MKKILSFLVALGSCTGYAQSYDNVKKEYELVSLTDAIKEQVRAQRSVLADYHPTGLYIKKGETFTVNVSTLDTAYKLIALIGFKPLWQGRNKQHEKDLTSGKNSIRASEEGLLFFTFIKKNGLDLNPVTTFIKVEGGNAVPFWQMGKTPLAQWEDQLATIRNAPYVQLVSPKVMITIPYENYIKTPIKNLQNSFDTIHKVIDWENECAGFGGNSKEHMPTRLRLHYVVDTYNHNGDGYYMYTTGYHIGMLRDNFEELTNPRRLATNGWGIWHETGHTNQQPSWTWSAIGEISVNIFSLYVQEKFEQPTPFNKPNSATKGMTLFESAKRYMAIPDKDYNKHLPEDNNPLFTKMMMFWQLKESYGWQVIQNLHKYFREFPQGQASDQEKISRFIYAMCKITNNDLRGFFHKWGLEPGAATSLRIDSLRLHQPVNDPSQNLTDKWKPKLLDTRKMADDLLTLENEYRKKKGLKPFKYSQFISDESMVQCRDMQDNGGFAWGNYPQRQKNIIDKYGPNSRPNFNMLVNEDGDPSTILTEWLNLKDGGGAADDYDVVGIGILQDPNESAKFYVAQYFAKETIYKEPGQLVNELLKLENDYRQKIGLKPFALKQELADAASIHSDEMVKKNGLTYGDYLGRFKTIKEKMGNNVKPELHLLISDTDNAQAIVNQWILDPGGPRKDIEGAYQYTGFGVTLKNGKYYIAQYVAYDPAKTN